MIKWLKYQERILLMAVTISDDCLEAAIGYFDKNLSEDSVLVANGNECYKVKIPEEAKNLKGRAKKYRVNLKIL